MTLQLPHPRTGTPVPDLPSDRVDGGVDGRPVVHLVGAGPGDPDLLTLRAARLLGAADVVAHDLLVVDEVLALAPDRSRRVPVGRRAGHAPWTIEQVADLLASHAHAGQRVVRIKGGDPMVFGRGGEEALALARRGIAVEVVPGVTSAISAPALAGIPVTHRGISSSVTIVTARAKGGSVHPDLALAAQGSGTLVILMAVDRIEEVVGALVDGGRPRDTPVAVVSRAGRHDQATLRSTLDDLVRDVAVLDVPRPALVVVGDVVGLAGAWPQVGVVPAGVATT